MRYSSSLASAAVLALLSAFRCANAQLVMLPPTATPPSAISRAFAINADGTLVAGEGAVSSSLSQAHRWDLINGNWTTVNLGSFETLLTSVANGVTGSVNSPVAVGLAYKTISSIPSPRATRWTGSSPLELSQVDNKATALAYAVSTNGTYAAGFLTTSGPGSPFTVPHAAFVNVGATSSSGGTTYKLLPLSPQTDQPIPLANAMMLVATAYGVNDIGTSVGDSTQNLDNNPTTEGQYQTRATLWSYNFGSPLVGELTRPSDINSNNATHARAINNSGTVVGFVDYSGGSRAVVWTLSGTTYSVQKLPSGNLPSAALAINADGDIAGYADNPLFDISPKRAVWWRFEGNNTWSGPYFLDSSASWQSLDEATGISGRSAGSVKIAGWGAYTISSGMINGSVTRAFVTTASALNFTVILEGLAPTAQLQTIDFDLRDSSGNTIRTETRLVGYGGAVVTFRNNLPAISTIRVKGAKWLRKIVSLSTGSPSPNPVMLLAGDGNNDNFVDVADLLLLINNYNKFSPDPAYSVACDYNCDGANDISDLLLVIANYNKVGE